MGEPVTGAAVAVVGEGVEGALVGLGVTGAAVVGIEVTGDLEGDVDGDYNKNVKKVEYCLVDADFATAMKLHYSH